ncbi:uncharacterized protein LOC133968401 [Platichthys flesus]|uniref:uncharacterized protein LOC133968401 n=1 Tax=Platichthys flesus TaxID=8260 RepID=UPI002DBCE9ED|nr:uncharacterized protein LOC133968401 [Platichthys flesus]
MLSLHQALSSLLLLSTLTAISCEELTPVHNEEFSAEGSSVTLSYNSSKVNPTDYFFWYRQNPGQAPEFLLSHSASGQILAAPTSGLKIQVEQNQIHMIISSAAVTDSAVYYCAVKTTVTGNYTTLYKNLWSRCWRKSKYNELDVEDDCAAERLLSGFILLQWKNIVHLLTDMNYPHLAAMGSMDSITPESTEEVVSEGRHINLTCKYDGSINSIQWYRQQQRSRPEFLLYITVEGSIHPTLSDFSAHINQTEKRVKLQISSAAVTDSAVYYCALQPTVTGNYTTLYKNLWSKHTTPHPPLEGVTHC